MFKCDYQQSQKTKHKFLQKLCKILFGPLFAGSCQIHQKAELVLKVGKFFLMKEIHVSGLHRIRTYINIQNFI